MENLPTITMVIHRPIVPNGSNGWGKALLNGYIEYVKSGSAQKVRIISAPGTTSPNVPVLNGIIEYEQVKVPKQVFSDAKKKAIDVDAWDLMHLIRVKGQDPLVVSCAGRGSDYQESWRNYFVYSIASAHRALELSFGDTNPVFQLNDVHDSFVSALFEGNYDPEWLRETIGPQYRELLSQFEQLRSEFLERHGSISHMRFWHAPAVEEQSWIKWFDVDPSTAAHFLAGVYSSPLVVHSPIWKKEFNSLALAALPLVAAQIDSANLKSCFERDLGVGPIAFDRIDIIKRFTKSSGKDKMGSRVPELLEEWSAQLRETAGEKQPIVFFLTSRGDDPKNNITASLQALNDLALSDPDVRDRLVVISVYSTSRIGEHEIYANTLRDVNFATEQLRETLGNARVIEGITKNGDLTAQTCGFMLANAFLCGARGGFDVVGLEALIVSSLRADKQLLPKCLEILERYGMDNSFRLVIADTVGAANYLNYITPNFDIVHSPDSAMPQPQDFRQALKHAWDEISLGRSKIENGGEVLRLTDEIFSAQECLDQWIQTALTGRGIDMPRTTKSIKIVDQVLASRNASADWSL